MTALLTIALLIAVATVCWLTIALLHSRRQRRDLAVQLQDLKTGAAATPTLARLVGAVAHDLNNLLTVITGNAQILAADDSADERNEDAKDILEASLDAAELTRRLLAFSRPDQKLAVPVNLNVIVGSMHKLLADVAGDAVDFEVLPSPELPNVSADPNKIERLLIEIVAFCHRRVADSGRIRLRTSEISIKPESGLFDGHGIAVGTYVAIQISDSGALSGKVESLFDPDGTDSTAGLARIVGEFGGRVYAEAIGEHAGLRIRVLIPAITQQDAQGLPAEFIQRGSGTLLLAEDNDQLRSYVHRALENLGYQVISARGAEEAAFLFRRHAEHVDLLVADVVMPVESGVELYGRLKAMNPHLPVLFISGYSADSLEDDKLLPEGALLLTKPFTIHCLARRVHALIGARRCPDGSSGPTT